MTSVDKPRRKADRAQLDAVKTAPCVVCNRRPTDPAHVRGRGAGGPDEAWNVMPLCRREHIAQTAFGWPVFARKHPSVALWLLRHGWQERGDGKLWHPRLAV